MSTFDNYRNRYGATINGKHTFKDWSLLPSTPPVISPPEPKLHQVDIPGADGILDLTESLTGDVEYGMRDVSMTYLYYGDRAQWRQAYRDLLTAIHGKTCTIVLDEEPDMTYTGRLTLAAPDMDGKQNKLLLTIEGQVYPWPEELEQDPDDWLWNPFNFETGEVNAMQEPDEYTLEERHLATVSAGANRTDAVYIPSDGVLNMLVHFSFTTNDANDLSTVVITDYYDDSIKCVMDKPGELYTDAGFVVRGGRTINIKIKNNRSSAVDVKWWYYRIVS